MVAGVVNAPQENVGASGSSLNLMGKRKTKRKALPKRGVQKLDKEFNCPICFSDRTVEVHLNHKGGVASTLCRACRNSYETSITPIDAEIDVFSAWIDAVEDGTAPGAQQSVLAEDLTAIPQSSQHRRTRGSGVQMSAPSGKRQRVADEEEYDEGEEDTGDDYLNQEEDDDELLNYRQGGNGGRRPQHVAAPPDIEDEIELPDEEEEYDFGDNNDEDDDQEDDQEATATEPGDLGVPQPAGTAWD